MRRISAILAVAALLPAVAAAPTNDIDLEIVNTEPEPLKTSEYADIWIEATNAGNADAESVRISFEENYPFSVERGDRKNWTIDELVPGETYQMHLRARVDENAVQGNRSLEFAVENGEVTIEETAEVEIRSDRNVLSVEEIEFPEDVAPGSSSSLELKMRNLADSRLKNIQAVLEVSESGLPFATSGSSSRSIESVGPGEVVSANYSLQIDGEAENSVYKLPIEISFENEAGNEFERTTTTAVRVGGQPDLKAGLRSEEPLTAGRNEITLRLANKGYGKAEFVSVTVNETEELEIIGSNKVYLGSMDADDFQTSGFEAYISPEQESSDGKLKVPLEISYSSDSREITRERTITAEIYSSEELKQYGVRSSGSLLPVAGAAAAVLVLAVYYWRRRRD